MLHFRANLDIRLLQTSIKQPYLLLQPSEEGWVVGDIHGRLVNARNLPKKRFHHVNVGLVAWHIIIALGTKYRSVRGHFAGLQQPCCLGTGSLYVDDLHLTTKM